MAGLIVCVIVVAAVVGYFAYLLTKPPAPAKPIKIGFLGDLTGALAVYGYSNQLVLSAAIRKINAEGGISGRPVELYIEDTETKVATAITRMRKLIEYYGVDFIIGSQHSGINIATNSIAKELRTVTIQVGEAYETTAEAGNRYVFRINNNVREQVLAGIEYVVQNVAKKWVTIVADYSWGWSNEEEFRRYAPKFGGEVLKSIRVPLGTKDFMPYLALIPAEAEAVFYAFFFTDFLSLIRDLHAVRPDLKHYSPICAPEGIDTEELGELFEGAYVLSWFPRYLSEYDTPYNREFRITVGIDEKGREVKTGMTLTLSHSWSVWEAMFALKRAIEESGWKSKEDNSGLIKALEGMEFKESIEFPQGDKFIRAQDHQAFMRHFLMQVVNGELKLVKVIPIETAVYPPEVDYTKEPL
jgi:branched-chain amino acid transport system substrate-binding protein